MHNWYVYKKFDDAAKAAADFIATQINDALKKKGSCHVVLPGGNTPASCLNYLSQKELSWQKIHWYLGDERCYPIDHAERNDVMLQKHLWSKLPTTNIHRIPAELGSEEAAKFYQDVIRDIEHFDIVFLGMGEDGHTASLFPGNKGLEDTRSVIPVHHSPKAPDDRVSLSVSTLQQSNCRVVLTGGGSKSEVISRIKNQELLPVNMLGDIVWYLDEEAYSGGER